MDSPHQRCTAITGEAVEKEEEKMRRLERTQSLYSEQEMESVMQQNRVIEHQLPASFELKLHFSIVAGGCRSPDPLRPRRPAVIALLKSRAPGVEFCRYSHVDNVQVQNILFSAHFETEVESHAFGNEDK
ncbi:uncharacterized [Tachysurus ichikawai]